MVCKITYKSSVSKDIKKIDKKQCRRLLNKLEKDLSKYPEKGKALAGNYEGLFSYRIGDYRIIYTILRRETILVLRIGHRKDIYR